ncbi:hypothetical protein BGK72_37610 [Streptomyces agglomeratus]|nr:hypothetical protein BGK72_37610 [Streptomyces agglomeratus]
MRRSDRGDLPVGVCEWLSGLMQQSWAPSIENDLRLLLNEWDPIGVADDVQDEYDCLLALLLQRLRGSANQREIGEFLRHELEDQGLPP